MSKAASPYISRLYHDKNDIPILSDAIDEGKAILLLGPTGTGKTRMAEEVAIKRGQRLINVPCHTGGTAEMLLGQMVPNPNFGLPNEPQFKWKDGLVTRAVKGGHILLLDEINSLNPEVTFCLHGLFDHRKELVLPDYPGDDDVIKAAPGFGVIAAGNPDYEGVQVMNTAFRDRFAVQLHVGYVADLDKIVINKREEKRETEGKPALAALQVAAVCEFIDKLRQAIKRGTVMTDVSTRAFEDLSDNLRAHTYMVARTIFETKFDDKEEMAAVAAIFDDVWDETGHPRNATVPKANSKRKKGAPKFPTGNNQAPAGAI